MRRPGIAGVLKKREEKAGAAAVGQGLKDDHAKHIESQLAQFKTRLEEFASKYRHDINRDPAFRCAGPVRGVAAIIESTPIVRLGTNSQR